MIRYGTVFCRKIVKPVQGRRGRGREITSE